ncbi:MAG: hypothetical protein MMC33_001435 [Icmadophila ericetorum]|nr:hypothetical protein [Icmadophila ericetorum]
MPGNDLPGSDGEWRRRTAVILRNWGIDVETEPMMDSFLHIPPYRISIGVVQELAETSLISSPQVTSFLADEEQTNETLRAISQQRPAQPTAQSSQSGLPRLEQSISTLPQGQPQSAQETSAQEELQSTPGPSLKSQPGAGPPTFEIPEPVHVRPRILPPSSPEARRTSPSWSLSQDYIPPPIPDHPAPQSAQSTSLPGSSEVPAHSHQQDARDYAQQFLQNLNPPQYPWRQLPLPAAMNLPHHPAGRYLQNSQNLPLLQPLSQSPAQSLAENYVPPHVRHASLGNPQILRNNLTDPYPNMVLNTLVISPLDLLPNHSMEPRVALKLLGEKLLDPFHGTVLQILIIAVLYILPSHSTDPRAIFKTLRDSLFDPFPNTVLQILITNPPDLSRSHRIDPQATLRLLRNETPDHFPNTALQALIISQPHLLPNHSMNISMGMAVKIFKIILRNRL